MYSQVKWDKNKSGHRQDLDHKAQICNIPTKQRANRSFFSEESEKIKTPSFNILVNFMKEGDGLEQTGDFTGEQQHRIPSTAWPSFLPVFH